MSERKGRSKADEASGRGGARRWFAILGGLTLSAVLIAFVASFLTGLGDGSEPSAPVRGDAESGGAQLDRIGPRVRVEVLNAGGVAGMARRATEHLRERGFDVVHIGNAGTFDEATTIVLARTADVQAAHRVAQALGTDSVVVEPDPQLYLDATVRLGRDWGGTGQGNAGSGTSGSWMDRLFD